MVLIVLLELVLLVVLQCWVVVLIVLLSLLLLLVVLQCWVMVLISWCCWWWYCSIGVLGGGVDCAVAVMEC